MDFGEHLPMTRQVRYLVLLLALSGCGSPPASPPPPPPTPAVTAPSETAPPVGSPTQARFPEQESVAIVQLVTDPKNPLGLDDAERKQLADRFFAIGLAYDRFMFRQAVLYPVLKEEWAVQPAGAWTQASPEAEFLEQAAAALQVLDERAAGAVATASPLPKELAEAATVDTPLDEEEGSFEKDLPADQRLSLIGMGRLLASVAPSLPPETAARVAVETREMVASAKEMQSQWDGVRAIALEGERAARVAQAGDSLDPAGVGLSDANRKAQAWVDAQRGR